MISDGVGGTAPAEAAVRPLPSILPRDPQPMPNDLTLVDSHQRFQTFYETYVRKLLPDQATARIIDIGCGSGPLLYSLRERGYTNYLGVDVSLTCVQQAVGMGLHAVQGEALAYLGDAHGEFDAITMFDVAEHLQKEDLQKVLAGAFQALRPGGVLLIHTANAWSPWSRGLYYGDITHEQIYSPGMLAGMAGLAGFREVLVQASAPHRDWSRRSSPLQYAARVVHTMLWRCVSLAWGMLDLIANKTVRGPYTPNFLFRCRRPGSAEA